MAVGPRRAYDAIFAAFQHSRHVPNLVVSETRLHPTGGTRIYQEGAQKIVGFDFRAALTMDMTVRIVPMCSTLSPRRSRPRLRTAPTSSFLAVAPTAYFLAVRRR